VARLQGAHTGHPMTNEKGTTPTTVDDTAWTKRDVAKYLKVGQERVDKLVLEDPTFPQPVPISERIVRWHPQPVRDWLRTRTEQNLPVRAATSGRRIVERV
jgi:predicted DNA-binding transcriptional regulator AlpA